MNVSKGVFVFCFDNFRYDFVEIEEPADGAVLGRWCGSQSAPRDQVSRGNQIRIRFVSDEYFPSEPGFCIYYSLVSMVRIYITADTADSSSDNILV